MIKQYIIPTVLLDTNISPHQGANESVTKDNPSVQVMSALRSPSLLEQVALYGINTTEVQHKKS